MKDKTKKTRIVLSVDKENTNDVLCKIGNKTYGLDMPLEKQEIVNGTLRKFILANTRLTSYEEDCMWMSYRYCIGRKTIASSMHAGEIWKHCKGRMSPDRQLFTAYDINREIERVIEFSTPHFSFPLTNLNKIYTTAVDIVCTFIDEYNIKSKEDLLKYRDVNIILTDNERGYKFEAVTWEEYLRPRIREIVQKYYGMNDMDEDAAWKYFEEWKIGKEMTQTQMVESFKSITRDMPNSDNNYFLSDLEDLFVWNNLAHCFDFEHHHKSVLIDGSECVWFWSWTGNTEKHDDGYYYKSFGYHKIRVPVNEWNGTVTRYIPDKSILEDLY